MSDEPAEECPCPPLFRDARYCDDCPQRPSRTLADDVAAGLHDQPHP